MPIYEYFCKNCRKNFSIFCRISEIPEQPSCENCSSTNTTRLVSRFRTIRSEEQILESMADPSMLSGIDENDPRSIAKWAKKLAKEMGEDMGDEIEAMAEEELAKTKAGKEGNMSEGSAAETSSEDTFSPSPSSCSTCSSTDSEFCNTNLSEN